MQSDRQKKLEIRTGKKAGIWLAFSFALGLHFVLLFLPIAVQTPVPDNSRVPIELLLTTFSPQPEASLPPIQKPEEPVTKPQPIPQLTTAPPAVVHEDQTEPAPAGSEPAALTTRLVARNLPPDLDNMSKQEKRQLTSNILMRQFITEDSAVDKLFGKPLVQTNTEIQQEFHYPLKQNMLTMLDQPLPDMPFAYTPGLVYFAYEPGVKGDLQRFWDVITPEFGWRTRYGTEVRCILVLVLVGCGWK
jgi:hypothetical protein